MDRIDLETSLHRPSCPRCAAARIRPIEIGDCHLVFSCPNCRWRGRAELPKIQKRILYLDTSIVSHMALALRRDDAGSPWRRLHAALTTAAAEEVLCCVGSSIVKSEAALSSFAGEIVAMSKAFGDPGLRLATEVRHAQLFRAMERYLAGTTAAEDTSLPREDAFHHDPHRWLPLFRVEMDNRYPAALVNSMRQSKAALHRDIESIYASYSAGECDFAEIRRREAQGYGRGIVAEARQAIQRQIAFLQGGQAPPNPGDFMLTTLELIAHQFKERLAVPIDEAMTKAVAFLESEHVSATPFARISATLHAALAMRARGPKARTPSPSDARDIDHLATFMPYVDVFIADRFMASMCNEPHLRLGHMYGTQIRSLGANEIDRFVNEIEGMRASSAVAALTRRIHGAIEQGGYIRERTETFGQWLRAQGVNPDAPQGRPSPPDGTE